jgi:hypothetical protein
MEGIDNLVEREALRIAPAQQEGLVSDDGVQICGAD